MAHQPQPPLPPHAASATVPQIATGQCFCGAVQIKVELPVKWIAHCHCSMCRRYHGAAFVTWFGVAHGRYHINETDVAWYASSPEAERGRCKQCGSPLFFRSTRWPEELHIALAAMNEPLDREPELHVYYGDRVNWVRLQPCEPCYLTVPSEDGATSSE